MTKSRKEGNKPKENKLKLSYDRKKLDNDRLNGELDPLRIFFFTLGRQKISGAATLCRLRVRCWSSQSLFTKRNRQFLFSDACFVRAFHSGPVQPSCLEVFYSKVSALEYWWGPGGGEPAFDRCFLHIAMPFSSHPLSHYPNFSKSMKFLRWHIFCYLSFF